MKCKKRFHHFVNVSCCLILALFFAISVWAGDEDRVVMETISVDKWQEMWGEIIKNKANIVHDETVLYRVEVPEELAVYFFTKAVHAAHPAIVKRAVAQQDNGSIEINTQAWVAGSREHFEKWLSAFTEQDRQVKKSVNPESQ